MVCVIGINIGNVWFFVFSYCGDFGQDWCNQFIGFFLFIRYNRRIFQCVFFIIGDIGINEVKVFGRKFMVMMNGVLEEGIVIINDDVIFIEIWFEGINSSICVCICFYY